MTIGASEGSHQQCYYESNEQKMKNRVKKLKKIQT